VLFALSTASCLNESGDESSDARLTDIKPVQDGKTEGKGSAPVERHLDALPSSFGAYRNINIKLGTPVNAYDFESADLDGKPVNLLDYRGSWVYIDFWATWCPPCMVELPHVAKLSSEFSDLKVIGISLDGSGDVKKVKDVAKDKGLKFPLVIDEAQATSIAGNYGVSSIPFSVLINPEGKIVMKAMRGEGMFGAIRKAMAE